MAERSRHSLSLKLIKISLVLALTISFILSAVQVAFDYIEHMEEQALVTQNILQGAKRTANRAVATNDIELARETILGLIEYPYVTRAVIFDTEGRQLVQQQRPPSPSYSRMITQALSTAFPEYIVPLTTDNPDTAPPGLLIVEIDQDAAMGDFYHHAMLLFLGDFIALLMLSTLLSAAFSRHVTRPLVLITNKIRGIDPRAPEQQRLEITREHRRDELGQLATSFNTFIQAVEDLINEREHNESNLRRNEELLIKTSKLAKVGGWDYDIETGELMWSQELCKILGLANGSVLDLNDIYDRIDPDYKLRVEKALARSIRNNIPFDIRFGMISADNKQIWVRAIGIGAMHRGKPIWRSGMLQDNTEHRRSEQALMLRDFALNQSPDAILTINAQGEIVVANDTTCERYGYTREEIIGQAVGIFNPDFGVSAWEKWWDHLKASEQLITTTYNVTKSGTRFPVEISSGYFIYDDKEFCIMSVKDITERKRQDDEIQHLAYHDTLTGLPNRSLLQDRLRLAITTARRHDYKGAVLFIDLDDFKKINDSMGHPAGDELLRELATRLSNNLREEDTVARLGGDEFVIILPYLSSDSDEATEKANAFAEKLLDIICQPARLQGHEVQVTASIGMVLFPDSADQVDSVLQYADTAMYQAKAGGRDSIKHFTTEMTVKASRQLTLENHLRNALSNDEFYLNVQPQYNSQRRLIGAEILLRWESPAVGPVVPAEFIPVLESTGMIFQVGEWVIRKTCEQIKAWLDLGICDSNLNIAVNISPRQFRQPNFVNFVAKILQESQIPHGHLCLEITEGMVLHNIDEIVDKLKRLRALGVTVSIDDFGTGYSSLSYLKRLPIDTLKIDQSFIRGLPNDGDDAAIVTAVIAIAKQLNLQVIAEGVENQQQIRFLEANDCPNFQGFFFGKPMLLSQFELLLSDSVSLAVNSSRLN